MQAELELDVTPSPCAQAEGEGGGGKEVSPLRIVKTESAAKRIFEKMSLEEQAIRVLQAQMAPLQGLVAEAQRRLQELHKEWDEALVTYARPLLIEGKNTFTAPYGSIAFRARAATLKLVDEEKALAAAHDRWPEAIKVTEKFLISALGTDVKEILIGMPQTAAAAGLQVVPAGEDFQIKPAVLA